MAKPIFLVGMDRQVLPEQMAVIKESLTKQMPDYHVIVYQSKTGQWFEVLNAQDLTELQFEELRDRVEQIVSRESVKFP